MKENKLINYITGNEYTGRNAVTLEEAGFDY